MNLDLASTLSDKIANNTGELNELIFANGFGKVTDIEIAPDGYLYVLSSEDEGQSSTKSMAPRRDKSTNLIIRIFYSGNFDLLVIFSRVSGL